MTVTDADTWRLAGAIVSVVVLFLLVVALVWRADDLPLVWRVVLWAVALQQGILAYVSVARADETPPGFPEQRADLPLVAITSSAVVLVVAVVGVFVVGRRGRGAAAA